MPKVDKTTEAPETWIFGRNDIECDCCAYCGGVARILGTVRSVSGPLLSRGVCLREHVVSASHCVTETPFGACFSG